MRFVLKKLATLLITLLILSFLAYAAFEMVGDPVDLILGTNATEEAAEADKTGAIQVTGQTQYVSGPEISSEDEL